MPMECLRESGRARARVGAGVMMSGSSKSAPRDF